MRQVPDHRSLPPADRLDQRPEHLAAGAGKLLSPEILQDVLNSKLRPVFCLQGRLMTLRALKRQINKDRKALSQDEERLVADARQKRGKAQKLAQGDGGPLRWSDAPTALLADMFLTDAALKGPWPAFLVAKGWLPSQKPDGVMVAAQKAADKLFACRRRLSQLVDTDREIARRLWSDPAPGKSANWVEVRRPRRRTADRYYVPHAQPPALLS